MVTDLQGVRDGNQFILTDPALLCKDKTRFGDTNLGRKFIEKCMKATEAMLEENGWDDCDPYYYETRVLSKHQQNPHTRKSRQPDPRS